MISECGLSLVPTKCTPHCVDKRPPFQAVVHRSNAVRLPAGHKYHEAMKKSSSNDNSNPSKPELEMKRVRYEVMRFSASKLEGREREEADVALAVSLGALPPKREFVNYKELLQKQKESKESIDVKPHSIAKLKAKLKKGKVNKTKKDSNKKKSRLQGNNRKKTGILESYGKPSKGKRRKLV